MATIQNANSQIPFPSVQTGSGHTLGERALIVEKEAINLGWTGAGAVRLDLNGARPAKEDGLNCLIDWARLQGIFLRPLCADQWVNECLAKPSSFQASQLNYVEASVVPTCNHVTDAADMLPSLPLPSFPLQTRSFLLQIQDGGVGGKFKQGKWRRERVERKMQRRRGYFLY